MKFNHLGWIFLQCLLFNDILVFGLRGVTKSNEFQKLELTTLWCMDLEDNNPQSGVVLWHLSECILILVFLLYKATHFWGVTGDCQLAAPTDFIRDISAWKLDSFWPQGPEEFRVNKWITYLKSHVEKCLYLLLSTINYPNGIFIN